MENTGESLSTWVPAVMGLLGVLLGTLLGWIGKLVDERIRQANRREAFAPLVFQKRLSAYEQLAELIVSGSAEVSQVISNGELSQDQRHDIVSHVVLQIAEFVENNPLYIDEELGAHCTALFMGVEHLYATEGEEKANALSRYQTMRLEAFRMINEESGVAEVNKLFKSINKPKLSGPLIERLRELRAQKDRGKPDRNG